MSVAMEDFPRRHRVTVDEYHHMAEVGLLARDARVELIEGEIVEMPPIGSRHAAVVDRLNETLGRAVGPRAIVRCQNPIQLGGASEPQPDLALLARRQDFYELQLPTGADTLLVIEVSDSTLSYDLRRKAALYARHGIPELWVIDVERRKLHLHRDCANGEYKTISTHDTLGVTSIASLPGVSVDLSLT